MDRNRRLTLDSTVSGSFKRFGQVRHPTAKALIPSSNNKQATSCRAYPTRIAFVWSGSHSDLHTMHPSKMSSSILVLTGKDVAKLLESPSTVDTALSSQRNAFQAYSRSPDDVSPDTRVPAIQAPLRTTLSSQHATTLVMPARADAEQGLGGIGIKVVSVPHEGDAGLPATTTIFDEQTGKLRAVVNARSLTALRNACGQSWS